MSHQQPLETITTDSNDEEQIAQEYAELFVLESLTEEQDKRMEEILTLAEQNETIDLLISQLTCRKGKQLHLLDSEKQSSYEDQRACLREYLGTWLPSNTEFSDSSTYNSHITHENNHNNLRLISELHSLI